MPDLISSQAIHGLAIAGCSLCACFLTGCFCWSLWHTTCKGIRHLRRLHQVPCDRCQYFTGEYLLKCTVHPCKAFSEEAIACADFQCNYLDSSPNSQSMTPAFKVQPVSASRFEAVNF